jgi:Ser/Thr protein kinase RdoA (MazF antagonist)
MEMWASPRPRKRPICPPALIVQIRPTALNPFNQVLALQVLRNEPPTCPPAPIAISAMLDVDCATRDLMERGLIDAEWIIDGRLTVRSAARRNRNLKVEGPGGKGFLIKQPDDPGLGGHATLNAEAAFHYFCRHEPAVADVTRFIPRLLEFDPEKALLVFELIPDAVSLQSILEEKAGKETAKAAARQLGNAMATLHRCFRSKSLERDDRLALVPRHLPWALGLHKPTTKMLAILSAANYQVLKILQSEEGLSERLDRLSQEWRPDVVIHGDMKFDNVLIQANDDGKPGTSVRTWIVDWEMVQIGDPAWDLAGALQDFLVLWVRSMPMTEDLSPELRIAQARAPLGDQRDTIRALWDGYRTTADLSIQEADRLLRLSVIFSAARLMQSAYEMLFTAQHPGGAPVFMLQIAANILALPLRAQVQLYGIPWRSSLS